MRMIDFHSHILPGVDHGASELSVSVQLLEQAKKADVTKIVATPHFYKHKDNVEEFLERRNRAFVEINNYIASNSSFDIEIVPAAEVALEKDLLTVDLRKLTIGDTDNILIEMPQSGRWYSWMFDMLYEIESRYSLNVILAHVDRYSKENMEKLLELGFISQINAESLVTGSFSSKRRMRSLCKKGAVHLIGSDAHDPTERSYREMVAVSKKIPKAILQDFDYNANQMIK